MSVQFIDFHLFRLSVHNVVVVIASHDCSIAYARFFRYSAFNDTVVPPMMIRSFERDYANELNPATTAVEALVLSLSPEKVLC